jgi:phospholipid/cholesterol/gamma-HCH transport system substrate-binding protein
VSGLEEGAPVKYNGVRIGKVSAVRVNPADVSEVLVELDIAGGTPIKKDVKAVIKSVGITGLKYVELTLGSNKAATLAPGAELVAGESDLDFLTGKAQVISERVDILLGQLIEITRPENVAKVDRILTDLADTLQDARAAVGELRERGTHVLGSLDELAGNAVLLTSDARSTLGGVMERLDRLVAITGEFLDRRFAEQLTTRITALVDSVHRKVEGGSFDQAVANVKDLTDRAKHLVATLDATVLQSQDDVNRTFSQLLEVVENLNDFSRLLKEDPSVLLRGASLEEKGGRR